MLAYKYSKCLKVFHKLKDFNLYLSSMNYRFGVKLNGAFQDLGFLWKDSIVGVGYGMNSAVVSTGRVKREGPIREE